MASEKKTAGGRGPSGQGTARKVIQLRELAKASPVPEAAAVMSEDTKRQTSFWAMVEFSKQNPSEGNPIILNYLKNFPDYIELENSEGMNIVTIAAKYGNINLVKEIFLLYPNAVLKQQGNKAGTPLYYAVIERLAALKAAEALKKMGKSERSKKISELTKTYLDIMDYLLVHGSNPNLEVGESGSGCTILQLLADAGDEEGLKMIFNKTQVAVDINRQNKKSWSAVAYALRSGHIRVANFLVDQGADINCEMLEGVRPVHFICMGNQFEAMIYLCSLPGFNVNAADNKGVTALHMAVELKRVNIVEHLLKCGANSSLPDMNGYTAYEMAMGSNNPHLKACFDRPVEPLEQWKLDYLPSDPGYLRHIEAVRKLLPDLTHNKGLSEF